MSDVLFPFGRETWTFGSASAPSWRTDIVETYGGHEQRNRAWSAPRLRAFVLLRVLSAAERSALVAFFNARGGAFDSFLLRDDTDPALPTYRVRFESDELQALAQTDPNLWQVDTISLIEVRE